MAREKTSGSASRFALRRDKLLHKANKLEVSGFLISHPINVSYLSGFSGEDSYLVVGRKSVLISDSRFTVQIEEECPGLEVYIRKPGQSMVEAVENVITSSGLTKVAFENSSLSVAVWESLREKCPNVEWVSKGGCVETLRAVKDADEIRQIREAIQIAERSFGILKASMRQSDDEKGLADSLEGWIRQSGGRRCAFPSIVAVGPRAALPHAVPTQKRVDEADFVLIDWGAKGEFYNSDLTRILATRKISRKLAKVYDVVLNAQLRAIEAIKPGVTGGEVDAVARSVIAKAGFGRYFTHSLGHGIGMEVHEGPSLRHGSTTVLEPGMVVTVEPGIYLRDWGGVRLEDDVLVTKDGCEVLTSVPKHLEEMTAARAG
jgi:Xaa-Pro aminopeptidase